MRSKDSVPAAPTGGPRRAASARAAFLAAVIVVVAAGLVAAGLAGAFGGGGPVTPAGGAYRTSTATVTHRTLVSQTELNASLGDSGSYSVVDQATGTLTALPAIGKVIRQGKVLYQVSGNPWCCCMAGSPPAAC